MNLVLVVLWSLATPYSAFRPMTSCLSTIWVCVIIVCKMLYQLSVVNPIEYSSNCTRVSQTHAHTGDVCSTLKGTEPAPTSDTFAFNEPESLIFLLFLSHSL